MDDLRSALESAFESEEKVSEEVSAETVEIESDVGEVEVSSGRERDEKGRFASKVEDSETEVSPEASQESETVEAQAPWDWNNEAKEEFRKLPKEAQSIILKRSKEWEALRNRQKAELDRQFQENHDIHRVVNSHRQNWALEGITPSQVLEHYAALHNFIKHDPAGAVRWIASQNGIDLNEAATFQEEEVDPAYQELQQELQELKAWRQQQETFAQQQHFHSTSSDIQSWAEETDPSGRSIRPFFQQVYSDMLPIVDYMRRAEPSKPNRIILQEAYDRAVWANPQTRQQVLQQQEAKRVQEKKQRVGAARTASQSLNGAPGTRLTPSMPEDLRGMLEAAFEQYS